jgi:hypothetical protein
MLYGSQNNEKDIFRIIFIGKTLQKSEARLKEAVGKAT